MPDVAKHRWLLRHLHDIPQMSKFELVRQRDGRESIGVEKGWFQQIPSRWIIWTPLSKGATTATRQNI